MSTVDSVIDSRYYKSILVRNGQVIEQEDSKLKEGGKLSPAYDMTMAKENE